jgi:hypothetical protein
MSKPITRVAFALLISLVLIAATYMTVQGAFPGAESKAAGVHTVNGLQTNFNHYRSTASELAIYQIQSQAGDAPHQGGCHSDTQTSPDD